MKRLAIALLVGWAMSSSTMAAPSGMGGIAPPLPPSDARCVLSTGGGTVDYGELSRWQLEDSSGKGNVLTFGKRSVSVTVSCPYTKTIRLALRGEQAVNGELRYGSRGHTQIRLLSAQLDGKDVPIIRASLNGVSGAATSTAQSLTPGQIVMPANNGHPAKGKVLVVQLEIEPVLPVAEARVGSRQKFESNLTFDLLN